MKRCCGVAACLPVYTPVLCVSLQHHLQQYCKRSQEQLAAEQTDRIQVPTSMADWMCSS